MDNILNFPKTTIVNKSVPKNAFWQRAEERTELKDFLTREFDGITWLYKLAASTLNVAGGESVHEIDVFYCRMKGDSYSLKPFCGMDKLLPRHTLFVVEYGKSIDIIMHHKECALVRGEKRWQCGVTEMQKAVNLNTLNLRIEGQTMDIVYTSLLSQISGLKAHNENEYKEQVELRKQIASLEKQITSLQSNIRKERQFSRQIEMNGEARALKKQQVELKKKIQADYKRDGLSLF